MTKEAEAILELSAQIRQNLETYVADEQLRTRLARMTDRREQIFETMAETDALVLELKQENINLSQQLTKLTGEVRKNVEDIASVSRQNMIVMIAMVLAVSFLLLVVLTTIISRSMQVSIRGFKHALSEMTPGNHTVRAQEDGKDEFSVFGQFVNGFLDKLYGILKAVRKKQISLLTK